MPSTTSTSQAVLAFTKKGSNSTLGCVSITDDNGKTHNFLAAGEPYPYNSALCMFFLSLALQPQTLTSPPAAPPDDLLPAQATYTDVATMKKTKNLNWVSCARSDTIVGLASEDQDSFVGLYNPTKSVHYSTVGNTEGTWYDA
ncbi:hypothetical protein FRC09_015176 [Ceratobasidium sp. 395]|nr:hypothetical protein FRC09_015176 [Ceratobasidium sp. 395]